VNPVVETASCFISPGCRVIIHPRHSAGPCHVVQHVLESMKCPNQYPSVASVAIMGINSSKLKTPPRCIMMKAFNQTP
jgi:hypothetical protein